MLEVTATIVVCVSLTLLARAERSKPAVVGSSFTAAVEQPKALWAERPRGLLCHDVQISSFRDMILLGFSIVST